MKTLLILLFSVLCAVYLAFKFFMYKFPLCTIDEIARYHLADKDYAVVYQRNCGATTGFVTNISIIQSNESLENKPGTIYSSGGQVTSLSVDNRQVTIGIRGVNEVPKTKLNLASYEFTFRKE